MSCHCNLLVTHQRADIITHPARAGVLKRDIPGTSAQEVHCSAASAAVRIGVSSRPRFEALTTRSRFGDRWEPRPAARGRIAEAHSAAGANLVERALIVRGNRVAGGAATTVRGASELPEQGVRPLATRENTGVRPLFLYAPRTVTARWRAPRGVMTCSRASGRDGRAPLVRRLEGFDDIECDGARPGLGERAVRERASQRFAGHELEHQEVDAFVGVEIKERRDVGWRSRERARASNRNLRFESSSCSASCLRTLSAASRSSRGSSARNTTPPSPRRSTRRYRPSV